MKTETQNPHIKALSRLSETFPRPTKPAWFEDSRSYYYSHRHDFLKLSDALQIEATDKDLAVLAQHSEIFKEADTYYLKEMCGYALSMKAIKEIPDNNGRKKKVTKGWQQFYDKVVDLIIKCQGEGPAKSFLRLYTSCGWDVLTNSRHKL